jgi:hypothetical protein
VDNPIEGELAEQLYLKPGYVRVGEIPNYAQRATGAVCRVWPGAIGEQAERFYLTRGVH